MHSIRNTQNNYRAWYYSGINQTQKLSIPYLSSLVSLAQGCMWSRIFDSILEQKLTISAPGLMKLQKYIKQSNFKLQTNAIHFQHQLINIIILANIQHFNKIEIDLVFHANFEHGIQKILCTAINYMELFRFWKILNRIQFTYIYIASNCTEL